MPQLAHESISHPTLTCNTLMQSVQQRVPVRVSWDTVRLGVKFSSSEMPLVVEHIFKNSWADQAKVKAGDELLTINGRPLSKMRLEDCQEMLANFRPLRLTFGRISMRPASPRRSPRKQKQKLKVNKIAIRIDEAIEFSSTIEEDQQNEEEQRLHQEEDRRCAESAAALAGHSHKVQATEAAAADLASHLQSVKGGEKHADAIAALAGHSRQVLNKREEEEARHATAAATLASHCHQVQTQKEDEERRHAGTTAAAAAAAAAAEEAAAALAGHSHQVLTKKMEEEKKNKEDEKQKNQEDERHADAASALASHMREVTEQREEMERHAEAAAATALADHLHELHQGQKQTALASVLASHSVQVLSEQREKEDQYSDGYDDFDKSFDKSLDGADGRKEDYEDDDTWEAEDRDEDKAEAEMDPEKQEALTKAACDAGALAADVATESTYIPEEVAEVAAEAARKAALEAGLSLEKANQAAATAAARAAFDTAVMRGRSPQECAAIAAAARRAALGQEPFKKEPDLYDEDFDEDEEDEEKDDDEKEDRENQDKKEEKPPAASPLEVAQARRRVNAPLAKSNSMCISRDPRVTVTLLGAKCLRNADWTWLGQGVSDPYCTCQVIGKGAAHYKTKVIDDNLNPVWNEEWHVRGYSRGDILKITVWDSDIGENVGLGDDHLGEVEIEEDLYIPNGFSGDVPLNKAGKGVKAFLTLKIHVVMPPEDGEADAEIENEFDDAPDDDDDDY
eukprot:TRINITY_DN2648_c0_g1_i1.p1 TRINITY_DN2648_c0_g1~~TRINITY_DN2648_c0_g1_i1.p1  ORF type:complete len:755 (+),score=200.04 TRINITY_DN2648_c0_g1_i1:46-2265(+)